MKGASNEECNVVKKRWSNRRSKQTSPVAEPSELQRDNGTSSKQQFPKASDITFSSLPTINFNEKAVPTEGTNTPNRQFLSSNSDEKIILKSCPKIIGREDPSGLYPNNGSILQQTSSQRKLYAPHWPIETVNEALEKGHIFKAMFRVNAHNRVEAYCNIDGVQTDVLINGIAAQNRAVEGDIVAIKVDPISFWTKMKGSAGTFNTTTSDNSLELVDNSCKGKNKLEDVNGCVNNCRKHPALPNGYTNNEAGTSTDNLGLNRNSFCSFTPDPYKVACDRNDVASSLEKLCENMKSFPLKRPTGRVVSIIQKSPRRDAVVGFLSIKQCLLREAFKKENKKKNALFHPDGDYILLIPNDPKFTKMMVFLRDLPSSIVKRVEKGDLTIENELIGALVYGWGEDNSVPHARILHIFGRGGEIEPHISAILFENNINTSEFSPELLSNLPPFPWNIPPLELRKRKDLRNICIFTIDPSTATDLDDALSVERLPDGIFRVGVHIADVSYFVLPDTNLDKEAQFRATSVYLSQRKIPMLPPLLSENVGSLNPGVDKLAFSIIWDINLGGEILNRWIGRTIIRSCCKLSYSNAQQIIDGLFSETDFPQVHGNFQWSDVCKSVKCLFEISKILKEIRYNSGALFFHSSKLSFLLDDDGIPYESLVSESTDSHFLVEEFMLLANTTAAEIIFKAYPDNSLLRMHPEPQIRKVKEFEAFCIRHGLELDTSSSSQFHRSMERLKIKLEDDPVLFDIILNYATKCMQLAKYFSRGEIKENVEDYGHYALGVPIYTHFTSPLRRYADIVVHRTLAAAIEAEEMYFNFRKTTKKGRDEMDFRGNCFTGICFNKITAESAEARAALSAAGLRNGVPCKEILVDIAVHCNERKLACRNIKDASNKLYMWFILKKEQILLTEARVLALGPRFMSIYIPRLAIERRINYDEVEDLAVEWLDVTSTLVLSLSTSRKRIQKRGSPGNRRTLEEVALITCPLNLELNENCGDNNFEKYSFDLGNKSEINETEPAAFPFAVSLLSTIPVALHAIGGDDGPLDIGARLYMSTYLR